MNSSTDTHSTMEDCPALEDLAAFLDDTLPAEECERIVAHLADCETCYEIFAGAAYFQLESAPAAKPKRKVFRFPFKGRKAAFRERKAAMKVVAPWSLAAAAMVVMAVGLPIYRTFFAQPKFTAAELVEPVQEKPGVATHLYDYSVMRGEKPEAYDEEEDLSLPASFMAGVFTVDLQLSAQSRDVERSAGLVQELEEQLARFYFVPEDVKAVYAEDDLILSDKGQRDKAVARLREISGELGARERDLEDIVSLPIYFDFGKWAEAGRLAADLRNPEFFETRENRRFLSWLLRQDEDRPDEEVVPLLRQIEKLWDAAGPEQLDYTALERQFEQIIRNYDV